MKPAEIKSLRERLQLSQAALAARCGVDRNTLARWERGHSRPAAVRLAILRRIIAESAAPGPFRQLPPADFSDWRGELHVWANLPFPAVRFFTIAGVRPEASRGGHAHSTCDQVIASMAGYFDLTVTPQAGATIRQRLYAGAVYYVPRLHWIELSGFSTNAVCLVLCSEQYQPPLTDFEKFRGQHDQTTV